MKGLIETKLQKLEQIRRNLLYNASCNDDLGKAYQEMTLEIVEGCEEVLKKVLECPNFQEKGVKDKIL